MKVILLCSVLFLMIGCSSSQPNNLLSPKSSSCADLFAKAIVTPTVVKGSYECLSKNDQDQWSAAGFASNDQDIANQVQTVPPSTEKECGPMKTFDETHNVKFYLLTWNSDGQKVLLRLITNKSDNLVDGIHHFIGNTCKDAKVLTYYD